MLTNINFGKYYERDSVVHKLSPVFKIISLLIMIVSIFFIDSYKDIIMLTSYLILMMIYSDINILTYLRNIYSIKIFLVFILIIDLIFNINNTIYDLYKLIFIIIYSSALTYTTSTSDSDFFNDKTNIGMKTPTKVDILSLIFLLSKFIPLIFWAFIILSASIVRVGIYLIVNVIIIAISFTGI